MAATTPRCSGGPMYLNFVFNVAAFNDPPTITVTDGTTSDGTPVDSTVDENTPGALLGHITVSDPNQILTRDDITISDDRFVVLTDGDGELWLALAQGVSLDHESEPSVDVTLTVTDEDGNTGQTTVTVTVDDVDEAPDAPDVTPAASNFMIEENFIYGLNLAVLNSEDPEGSNVTFQVDNEDFEIEVIGPVAILKLKHGVAPDREDTQDGTITLTITASDATGNVSDPTEVVVTIVNLNDAPTGMDSVGAVTAGANRPATGDVNAQDVDGDTLSFTVQTHTSYGTLRVDAAGAWTYTLNESHASVLALARGVTLEDTATIVIADGNGGSASVDVTITITGVNEAPSGDDGTGAVTVGDRAITGNVNIVDVDSGDTHTVSVTSAASYGRLTVTNAGTWTYRLNDNHNVVVALGEGDTLQDSATLVIRDASGASDSVNVTITITGVNDVPTADDGSGTVAAGGGTVRGNVNASDADTGDTLSYSVGTTASYGTLSVNNSGAWTYTLDNTNDDVVALAQGDTLVDIASVVVSDGNGGMTSADVTITINGVNDAPMGEDASGAVLRGGSPDTGNVNASDVDRGDSLSLSVGTAPEYGELEVDARGNWTYTLNEQHSEVIALADDATLADEGTILIADSNGASTEVTISITVYATNSAPTISVADGQTSDGTSAVSTIDENMAGLALGIITVSDDEQQLGAGHVSTSDDRFVIKTDSSGSLFLALADGVSLDYEAEPTVDVTVTVTDDLDATAEQTVTITVNNANDPPEAPVVTPAASNFVVQENDDSGPNLADISSEDPEGDRITFQVDNQDFEIEVIGSAVLLKLKDGVALDREATVDGTITINITATDPSGAVSEPTPVVITVEDVNEAPSLSVMDGVHPDDGPAVSTIDENSTGPVAAVLFSDPEQALDKDDITLDDDRFSIQEDSAGGLWLFLDEPVDADSEPSVTVELEVIDGTLPAVSAEVTLTITDVNEAPTIEVTEGTRLDGERARAAIRENDTGPVGLITIGDSEDDLDATDITLSNTRFATETDSAGDIWLVLDEAANYETDGGTLSVTLTVTDSGGLTAVVEFNLSIVDVNESPTITVADGDLPDGRQARSTIQENTTGPVGAITVFDPEQTLSVGDIEVDDDRFSVRTDRAGGFWLFLDEALDAETDATVTVELEVTDDFGFVGRTEVIITVQDVNEAPTIEVGDGTRLDGEFARAVISENDTGPVGLITLGDPEDTLDADDITLSNTRFEIETDSGGSIWLVLNEAADFEMDGATLSVTLTVTDTGGLSTELDFDLSVVDVNEQPTITVMDGEYPDGRQARSTIQENTTGPVGAITVFDPEQTFDATDITLSDSRFSVEADPFGALWLWLNEGVDADTAATLTVELEVTDSGGLVGQTDVTINVQGVNEAPTITVRDATRLDGTQARSTIDENETGPIGLITISDPEDQLDASSITLSDSQRFSVETDSQGDIWLLLNEAADYETDGGTLNVTLTVTDSGGLSSEVDFTLTVANVNDPPVPNQEGLLVITREATARDPKVVEVKSDLAATAGTGELRLKLDLSAMFSDQDGDTNLRYHLEDGPSWLSLTNIQFLADGSVTGELVGTVPSGSLPSAIDIQLVATDADGERGAIMFTMIVDDGNDPITDIDLVNPDGTANDFKTVDIAENDDTGVVIGTLTAEDADMDARHPNGMHSFEVGPAFEAQFEAVQQGTDWVLKVKDGVALDFEAGNTINLDVIATDGGGSTLTRSVTVNVTDTNDIPSVKNAPGNWWVTVDENISASDVTPGQWLTFALETGNDARPLFEDLDAGETLTYSIVRGPAWLEIDSSTGVLQNKAMMLPDRGIYDVTVQVTDSANESAQASFKIAVVLSDANNADNSEPDIKRTGIDIPENAVAGTKVATIEVEDEDLDVAGIHPWGDLTIVVEATATDANNNPVFVQTYTHDGVDNDNELLELRLVREGSDSVTYDIVLTEAGAEMLDAENFSEVDITVTAYDGTVAVASQSDFDNIDNNTDGADITTFDFDIDDVNEAPMLIEAERAATHSSAGLTDTGDLEYAVEQQQAADSNSSVHSIYLNLSQLFEDPDDDHDDSDYTLTATISSTPWLQIARHWNSDTESFTSSVVKWEDIKDGRDEDANTADDVDWGPSTDPDDDDYVLILEVDRTGMDTQSGTTTPDANEIRQDADASITIVARDEDGARSTTTIAVTVTDENLNPRADGSDVVGVRISDTTPREKDTITISFNENVDPDFTGSRADSNNPVAVIHQVINVDGNDSSETILDASVDSAVRYRVTQEDVGDVIQGKVVYFELFDGSIVASEVDNAALELDTMTVADRQDSASITFSFSTNASDVLVATTSAQNTWDPDGLASSPGITYTWESSANGRGGWTPFDADGVSTTPDGPDSNMATIPSDIAGTWVRLVISFEDSNGVTERVVSQSLKVGTIDTLASGDIPTIDAGGQSGDIPVGRTLRIDLTDATPTNGSATAQWLADDDVVGTGTQYRVTEADRGKTISVRITSRDDSGNVTSIVTTAGRDTVAAPVNSGPISPEDMFTIDLGAAPAEEGDLASLRTTVPMLTLFEDIEGGLTFDFASPAAFASDSIGGDASLDVYHDENTSAGEGDQLLIIDEATGAVRYYTTMAQTHDDDNSDGAGNFVTTVLTANDAAANNGGGASDTIDVRLRIDVAPTDIQVSNQVALTETAADDTPPTTATDVASIDVQDQNMGDHAYGQYTFSVSDSRFEVVTDTADGSMATLQLKAGVKLDFEAITGDVNNNGNKVISVVVTATPMSGNFQAITTTIEVEVSNDSNDDPVTQNLGNNMVPGLKDNETTANDDDTEDDNTDNDEDGGTPIPMDAFFTVLDDGMF